MSSRPLTPQFLAEKTWDLYQSHGVPIELSEDILEKNNLQLDRDCLNSLIESHQKLSQSTSAGQFKSGLGENTNKTRQLHTLTHILHQVLRQTFGTNLQQMGSAITDAKARFDFKCDVDLSPEIIQEIQNKVEQILSNKLVMLKTDMTQQEAKDLGAIGLFGEKYGERVTIYTLTDEQQNVISREFCGGPHIDSGDKIGKFSIIKYKSVGQGIKRIEFDIQI